MDKSNNSGSMEFNIMSKDTDGFFPVVVEFSSPSLFCDVDVAAVVTSENESPIMYGFSKIMGAEDYTIE